MRYKKQKITQENDVIILLQQYMREHDTVSARRTKYAVKALDSFFSGCIVTEINVPLCRQYIAFRMDKGVAMSTVARELTTLRAACNHAYKWERIKEVPRFEVPTDLPRREVWLFKDEIGTIIDAATPDVENFIRMCYITGSRKTAIEQLTWDQVNFSRKTIDLAKPDEPKTTKRRPTVPMGDLFPLLSELYNGRLNDWVLGSDKNMSYEFEKILIKTDLLNVGQRDGRPAGKITPHALRHSRATHMLEDGVSIYAVAKLLGDTPMTVQRVYGHICMSSLEDELSKSSL